MSNTPEANKAMKRQIIETGVSQGYHRNRTQAPRLAAHCAPTELTLHPTEQKSFNCSALQVRLGNYSTHRNSVLIQGPIVLLWYINQSRNPSLTQQSHI